MKVISKQNHQDQKHPQNKAEIKKNKVRQKEDLPKINQNNKQK
jgi:hypothetical protein